jgi:competence protein ComEC
MTLLAFFLGGVFLFSAKLLPLPILRALLLRTPLFPWLIVATLPILALYTCIIGLPPAAVRAFFAFLFVSLLKLFFIELDFSEILGLSILIMLFSFPALIHSLSFDLSVLALWGIVLSRKFQTEKDGNHHSGRTRLAEKMADSLPAGLAITLLTAPLLALVFRTANPAGILSNPVVVPLAGDLLLPLGFLDLLVFSTTGSTLPLFQPVITLLSHIVFGLVHGFASLPGSQVDTFLPHPLVLLFFYLAGATLLISPGRLPMSKTLAALGIIFVLSMALGGKEPLMDLGMALEIDHNRTVHYSPRAERANLGGLFRLPRRESPQRPFPHEGVQ